MVMCRPCGGGDPPPTRSAAIGDLNPDTRLWAYPDSGEWDPERNVREVVQMAPEYRRHGLLAVTVNLQGGHPRGYRGLQPWINTAFTAFGELRPAYLERMRRVLDALDAHGMVAIVGLYLWDGTPPHRPTARTGCGAGQGGRRGHGPPDLARRNERASLGS
jgi:hypothetical protein